MTMQPPSAQPPPPEDVDRFYATLLRALAKSPRLIGLTFRGHQEAIEGAAKGAVVSTGLVATSRDPRVATLNGTITSLYAVLGDLGAQLETISQAPQEREVVFLPSTLFVIGMTEHIAGFDVTYVEQINPDRDPPVSARLTLDWARETTRTYLERSNWDAQVAILNPGKFVVPLS